MLALSGNARLFLYHRPINMRKSFEGLSGLIEESFPGELMTGSYFIFLNRRRDLMKVLVWDWDGFVIWFKRLEKGSFSCSWDGHKFLDRKTFFMLLEGIVPKRIQKRFSL